MTIRSILRLFTDLLFPGAVFVAAAAALQWEPVVFGSAAPYATYFAVAALAVSGLLSWYYDQSRLLASAAVVALAAAATWLWPVEEHAGRVAALLLLPLNFALFARAKEHGVMTASGVLRIGLVALQGYGVSRLAEDAGGWGGVEWPVAASVGVGALSLVTLVISRRTKVEQGLLWAFVAATAGLLQTDPAVLAIYAGTAGLVLVLAVLEHGFDIAYRDELTGLPSRRAFASAAGKMGGHYAIAMCDVDRFKQFNDTHGHDAGDQALRRVANQLSRVGGGGRAFRYGGEEFLIVFRGLTAREAEPFADAVRVAIDGTAPPPSRSAASSPGGGGARPISISIGLADRSASRASLARVLEAADAALYAAKDAGRNRVRVAGAAIAAGPAPAL